MDGKMTTQDKWLERREAICQMCLEGKTLKEIGDRYGVSKQRIGQVMASLSIEIPRQERGRSLTAKQERAEFVEELYKRTGRREWKFSSDLQRAMVDAFRRKRQNVRHSGWEWTISFSDISFPTVCPILGIEIDWFSEVRAENSASFDRVDSTKGYIPGNVIICSWRANRIKNNGTAEEHQKIADFLRAWNH